MLSLERTRQVAELCQLVDEHWHGVGDEKELPSLWQERVFSFAVSHGTTFNPPFDFDENGERQKLFTAICNVLLGLESLPTTLSQPSYVPSPSRTQVREATSVGGWVMGPDGKNVWTGRERTRQPRSATPEEMARIAERIREAEAKRGDAQ